MAPVIMGRKLFEALVKAGIADEMTRRVTIDIPCDDVVTVYVERYGDALIMDILRDAIAEEPSLQIDRVERPEVPEGMVEVTQYGDAEPRFVSGKPTE